MFAFAPATATFVCAIAGGDGRMLLLAAQLPMLSYEWAAFGEFALFASNKKQSSSPWLLIYM
jgi:hypothetical protein